MARTYKRDARGRFASGGGSGGRPKAKSAPRGKNRITRDNAGRITSVGGDGATARGGRLRTAAGNQRATQTARLKGGGGRLRGGKGMKKAGVEKKAGISTSDILRRQARARADRSSIVGGGFNMKLNTRSAITRSAANAIYNRQRQIAKMQGGRISPSVAKSPIGIMQQTSGSPRQRADQVRESARKRVVGGRRR